MASFITPGRSRERMLGRWVRLDGFLGGTRALATKNIDEEHRILNNPPAPALLYGGNDLR